MDPIKGGCQSQVSTVTDLEHLWAKNVQESNSALDQSPEQMSCPILQISDVAL
jgi:hypothetical protein